MFDQKSIKQMEHLPENNTGKKNLCFTQDNEGRITGNDFSSEIWLDKTGLMASGPFPAHSRICTKSHASFVLQTR